LSGGLFFGSVIDALIFRAFAVWTAGDLAALLHGGYYMDSKDIAHNIGYCGLVCSLCHEADVCGGCKSDSNCCGRHMSEEGCFQFDCCVNKGLNGCWECTESPCDRDMFSEHHDIRNRTFVKIAKMEGIEMLAEYVAKNQKNGIFYGWNRDYDHLESEEAVIDLLHNGLNSPYVSVKRPLYL